MAIPARFSNLPDSAFPRVRALLSDITPRLPEGEGPMVLTIGEPRHAFPDWVPEVMAATVQELGKYPPNEGTPELLAGISGWLKRRHRIDVPPAQITVLNGSREGLFNACLALCPEEKRGQRPKVLIPNPFYQVYAAAAAAAGAEVVFVTADQSSGHLPDFAGLPAEVLDTTAIAYLCSPANPQGTVASEEYLEELITLAESHDFVFFADECYSELWRDTPPVGALEVAFRMGLPHRVVMFNSLSKRSNLPGARSGFAAGGPEAIARLRHLRSLSGAPLPLPIQRVSERAWADEDHVAVNRALYQQKFAIADRIFGNVPGYLSPEGGFFLWLPVEDGEAATRKLWQEAGIQVVPGAYLAREVDGQNPGKGYIRVAMVDDVAKTEVALTRLHATLYAAEG